MKKRLADLSSKIKTTIEPVFISRKLNEDLKVGEVKPATVNKQYVDFINFNVTCAMQDMLVTLATTSTNALMDIVDNL